MELVVWLIIIVAVVGYVVYIRPRQEHARFERIAAASRTAVPTVDVGGQRMTGGTESTGQKSTEDRKQILAQAVANTMAQPGAWRVESQSDFNAILVSGRRVNHVLHLILSIVTVGFWIIVWIIMAIVQGEKKHMLTVDNYGNLSRQKL